MRRASTHPWEFQVCGNAGWEVVVGMGVACEEVFQVLFRLFQVWGFPLRPVSCWFSSCESLEQAAPMRVSMESLPGANRFWLCLESIPGGSAFPTIWKQHLGADFPAFKSLFLKSQPGE